MLASADAETMRSLSCRVKGSTALTKSLCPWNRFASFLVEIVHDQTDLSQHPAYTVSDLGETARDVRGATGPAKVAITFLVCKGSPVSHGSACVICVQRNGGLTDFKIDPLHVAGGLGDVYLILILGVCDDGKDLGWELQRVAFIVLRLGCLACRLFECGAVGRQRWAPRRQSASLTWSGSSVLGRWTETWCYIR